jgi:rhodanese-related sulfurtransferase
MPRPVDRQVVQRLVAEGAQLVEVLPRVEYDEEHLPGAIHVPLKQLTEDAVAALDRGRPVVVYCWDALCDMSPRAAARLELLGFSDVYDYASGKVDWMAAGLPTVRADTRERRVIEAADRYPPVCAPTVGVAEAAKLARTAGRRSVVVTNEAEVVLGRADLNELGGGQHAPVASVMQPGPPTVRAHEHLHALIDRMTERNVTEMIVSTPEGKLLGVYYRDQDQ